jgi:hypothetical protein
MTSIYTETRVISLNSEDAVIYKNSNYLSDVMFAFAGLVVDDSTILQRQVTILNAQIPVSFYIINYTNNVFIFRNMATSTNYTITIGVGNYNSSNFITTVQTAILTVTGLTITITLNKIDGKLTFSSSTNYKILSSNSSTTSSQIFGFDTTDLIPTLIGSNYVATCPYALNLLGIKQLQIKSTYFSANCFASNSGGQDCVLATIPVDCGSWGMITYNSPSSNNITFNNANLDEFDIKITDAETGKFINFNGANWTMTILIHLIRKIDLANIETDMKRVTKPIDIKLPEDKKIPEDKKLSLKNPDLEELRILES